jgi:Tetrahydrofolate dehydrogenase/cyclohydrolase, catalytic domain
MLRPTLQLERNVAANTDLYGLSDFCHKRTGERRDSATYVRMKKKACDEIGIMSHGVDFASDVTQDELLRYILLILKIAVLRCFIMWFDKLQLCSCQPLR